MKRFILCLFIMGNLVSCMEDEPSTEEEESNYNVDPVFEIYVQEFINEGAKRGHTIDFSESGLRIQFSELPLEGAAGLCRLGRFDIEIDKENWFRFSDDFQSYLVFHELGHCELDRLHRNDIFKDGTWKSILRGDPFSGIENRKPVPYFGFRVEYYIDELFNETIEEPAWSKTTYSYETSFDKSNKVEIGNVSNINERFENRSEDYEFEIDFNLILSQDTRTKLEWGVGGSNYYIYIIPNWGFYIGVNSKGIDTNLYYSDNLESQNNKSINKITVRRYSGIERVFINDIFTFHIDAQKRLNYIKFLAMNGRQINERFVIKSFVLNDLN